MIDIFHAILRPDRFFIPIFSGLVEATLVLPNVMLKLKVTWTIVNPKVEVTEIKTIAVFYIRERLDLVQYSTTTSPKT